MMRVLLITIIVYSAFLANTAFSQEQCPDPDKTDREAVINLFKDIRNPDKNVPTTVAGFISLLPEGMRSNYIMMSESRSFQQSNYENPRVLMKSENAGVIASFTGHGPKDGLRGTEKLEFVIWNGPEARYDFYEVDFPEEDPFKDPSTLSAAEKRPVVKQNPASCLNCHGSAIGTGETLGMKGEQKMITGALGDQVLDSAQARPNWDPYNFWQGQIPFNRDTLFKDSEETKKYLDLIRKVEGKPSPGQEPNARLAALEPMIASSDLEKVLEEDGRFQLRDYNDSDGPGVTMFDSSTPLNFCRIANNLKKLPFYENVKYAIDSAANACDVNKSLPPEAKAKTEEYFMKRGFKGPDFMAELIEDTRKKQQSVAVDKEARQRQTFALMFKTDNPELSSDEIEERVNNEMNKRERENREVQGNAEPLARMRYILEPLGVQVDNWSMSIDPGTYSFADLLNIRAMVRSDNANLGCKEIEKRSQQVYFSQNQAPPGSLLPDDLRALYQKTCDEAPTPVTMEEFSMVVAMPMVQEIEENAKNVFMMCAGCHMTGANGAPAIPFNDIQALRSEIKSTSRFPNGGLGASIINRINKPAGSRGHMPMGPASLTTEQKKYVRDFIGVAQELD